MVLSLALIAALSGATPTSFQVEVEGRGAPLILIPGLACGADVWKETVARYKDRYQVHTLTLAGFAGQPAIKEPLLPTVAAELAAYIREKRLQKPTVVGHSLGGVLAMRVAATEPDLLGAVVSVDGVPFLPALMDPSATAQSVAVDAGKFRERLVSLPIDAFRAQQRGALARMVTGRDDLDRLAKMGARSDPWSVGSAMYDVMTTDSRPAVSSIRVPLLLIAAGALFPAEQRPAAQAAYEAQVKGVRNHQVVLAENARHFIMLDDRAFFFATLDRFLAGAVN